MEFEVRHSRVWCNRLRRLLLDAERKFENKAKREKDAAKKDLLRQLAKTAAALEKRPDIGNNLSILVAAHIALTLGHVDLQRLQSVL